MRIEFDPRLVEEVVHRLARADRDRWRDYRQAIDPLYERPDREERIPVALLGLFRAWGAAGLCETPLSAIADAERALVAQSQRPGDEGADLLVGGTCGRTLMVRIAPERFLEPEPLGRFLRHELRHVGDLLDPAFGYEPDLGVRGRTRAEKEIVRQRYRVLWNLAVDAVEPGIVPPDARRAELDRAFAALAPDQRTRLARRFADEAALRTHASLLHAARDPWDFLGEPRTTAAVPGQPCPLCGFPTYDWADEGDLPVERIREDEPAWTAAAGACRQCADLYSVRARAS